MSPISRSAWRSTAFVLLMGGACPLSAQADDETPQDRLFDLATIQITSELCHLDLSDSEADAIATIRNKLVDDGSVTPDDIATVHDQLEATMTRQLGEGLCKPDGAGIRFYNQKRATLAPP